MNSNVGNRDSRNIIGQIETQGNTENEVDNAGNLNISHEANSPNTTQSLDGNFSDQFRRHPIHMVSSQMHQGTSINPTSQSTTFTNLYNPQYGWQPQVQVLPDPIWNPPILEEPRHVAYQNYYEIGIPNNSRNEEAGLQGYFAPSTINPSETIWEKYDSTPDIYQSNQPQGQDENWAESTGVGGSNIMELEYWLNSSQSFDTNRSYEGGIQSHQNYFPQNQGIAASNAMHQPIINMNYNYHGVSQQTSHLYNPGSGESVQAETFQQQLGFLHQPNYSYQNENVPSHQQLRISCQTEGPFGASHPTFQIPGNPSHPNILPSQQQQGNDPLPITHLPNLSIQQQQTRNSELGLTKASNLCAICNFRVGVGRRCGSKCQVCIVCAQFFAYNVGKKLEPGKDCVGNCQYVPQTCCKLCRLNKCIQMGMKRVSSKASKPLGLGTCPVCQFRDGQGSCYGSSSPVCEGCKKFFSNNFDRKLEPGTNCVGNCQYVPSKYCKLCRFNKCIQMGMKKGRRRDEAGNDEVTPMEAKENN